nr:response regulator [Bacteroidota bacterium]
MYSVDRPWQSGQPLKHVKNPSLAGASLLDLMEDSQGRIWATTANRGLYCIKPNDRDSLQARRYLHEHYSFGLFTDRNVHEVYEDINHNIWMRSVDALFKYNESIDSIEYHAPFNDLFKGDKYNFTGDNSGHLWFITEKGLLRYNPVDNTQRSLKLFGQSDGFYFDILRHTDINKNRSGQFHIGGTGEAPIGAGFCRFHPDSVHGDNLHLPEIVITDFKIRNEPAGLDSSITWKKHIRLKHNQNFFSFEFAAIEYRDPEKNQHAFMLEGFDEDWNYSGTRRFANYTGVPPGEYIFRVKGSNNDGYWNEKGTAINLTILPPPWKTWWAYTLYSLLTISLIYIWRRYDLKRHRLKQALEIEHVEAEKLKELDKMKSRFFANISHEFRTPLTLILGPIGKLMTKISDKESIGDLNMMQRNALRLQNLINQLLTLSKLESDQMKLHAVEENLTFLVKGYVQSFESLAIQRKVKLTLISNEENIPVFIDRDKLEKILYNLLSNAFKFTGEGGRIEVEITPLPPSRGDVGATPPILKGTGGITSPWVSISVTDTGRGIPIEKVPHIFDRFYQADDSHTRDQEGSGIGLALTKELVELHHGKISVKSELHSGTVFSIWFPMGRDHLKEDEIVRQIEKMDSSPAEVYKPIQVDISEEFTEPLKGPNQKPADFSFEDIDNGKSDPVLLIVEDNSDLRAYIRSYLDPGFKVIEAFDGEHGLRKATELIPDLIVSDVMMPKMDGVELCMRLKTDERTSHIPVILLTAKASIEDKLEGLETGADDFITKPFDPQELQVRIKNLISQREKLREYYTKEIGVTSTEPTGKINSMDQQFLQKLKKIVDEKMNESDFGVENLSSEMAMSRVQMHRKLKALLNQSAGDLIRYSRLQQAAKLLKSKSKTVTEIAYQVGFNNLSYFAKCFQEQYGVNPSEY